MNHCHFDIDDDCVLATSQLMLLYGTVPFAKIGIFDIDSSALFVCYLISIAFVFDCGCCCYCCDDD